MKEQQKVTPAYSAIFWFACIFPSFLVGSLFGGIIIGTALAVLCVLFLFISILGPFIKPKKS